MAKKKTISKLFWYWFARLRTKLPRYLRYFNVVAADAYMRFMRSRRMTLFCQLHIRNFGSRYDNAIAGMDTPGKSHIGSSSI